MERLNQCSCGCHNYKQTMDEVVNAAEKHRKSALALKEVSEKQKVKINEFRERTIRMQDDIDNLELDLKESEEKFTNLSVRMKERDVENDLLTQKLITNAKEETAKEEAFQEENRETKERLEQLLEDVDIGYEMVQRRLSEIQTLNKTVKDLKNNLNDNAIPIIMVV